MMIDNLKAVVYSIGMTLAVCLFIPILPFLFFWSYKEDFDEDEYEEWG
jgi:hypothetical protein